MLLQRESLLGTTASCVALAVLCGLAWHSGLQDFISKYLPWTHAASADAQNDAEDVPDEYRDPITYDIMADPVVLCATGQVYDYTSLRQWFAAGNFRCPKTNLDVFDAHVTRLPWLKSNILDWLRTHHHPLPLDPHPTLADIEAFQPQLAICIRGIRSDTGVQRTAAAAALVRQLRRWMDSTSADDTEALSQQEAVRAAVMEDMLWMVRYGDEYLQGIAASVLACCCLDEELSWLAATAIVPLVALLYTGNSYSQEWSLQTLYNICLRVPSSRPLLWRAGCVQGLLQLLSLDKAHVPFHRDRAAVMLATMAHDMKVKTWLQDYGVVPLVKMLLESSDRWEQRDAAFALLALHLDQQDLQLAAAAVVAHNPSLLVNQHDEQQQHKAAGDVNCAHEGHGTSSHGSDSSEGRRRVLLEADHDSSKSLSATEDSSSAQQSGPHAVLLRHGVSKLDQELLARFRWCSQKYLDGEVDEPDAGLTVDEIALRQAYETAVTHFRQVHEGIEAPEEVQQQQQQPQEGQGQVDGQQDPQQQQQQAGHQNQHRQQHHQEHLDQNHQQRRRQRGQRLALHWMAEHDADGDSGAADDAAPLSAGSSSSSHSSDEPEGSDCSVADGAPEGRRTSLPWLCLR